MAGTHFSGPVYSANGFISGGVPSASAITSTITVSTGATNTATLTVQLKDGSGTNITSPQEFLVYSSSAADGLTKASAASTGYSVASGGMSLPAGQGNSAVTQGISCISSATGGCVLSLLDTGKITSYPVLVVNGKILVTTQLTAGNYG